MDPGTAILISSILGGISFLIRDTIQRYIREWRDGKWMEETEEIVEGDWIRVKSEFGEMEGTVKDITFRNVIIETEEGDLMRESSEIMKGDVLRRREEDED